MKINRTLWWRYVGRGRNTRFDGIADKHMPDREKRENQGHGLNDMRQGVMVEVLRIDANSHELDERRPERQERSQKPDDEESMSAPDGAAEPGQQQKGCRKINRERDPELLRDEKRTHAEQDELKKSSAHEPTRRASTGN